MKLLSSDKVHLKGSNWENFLRPSSLELINSEEFGRISNFFTLIVAVPAAEVTIFCQKWKSAQSCPFIAEKNLYLLSFNLIYKRARSLRNMEGYFKKANRDFTANIKGEKFKIQPNSSELINTTELGVKQFPHRLPFKCTLSELNSFIYKKAKNI